MELNKEDRGNRKFIMVQLPEVTDEKSEAYKEGYKNICEIPSQERYIKTLKTSSGTKLVLVSKNNDRVSVFKANKVHL